MDLRQSWVEYEGKCVKQPNTSRTGMVVVGLSADDYCWCYVVYELHTYNKGM